MSISKDVLDEDLLLLLHQGNLSASEELLKRYDRYSWRLAIDYNNEHPKSGISVDDYHQIAFAATPKAIRNYVVGSENGLFAFWRKIAENEINRYYSENAYQYGGSRFNGLSLNTIIDDGYELSDSVGEVDRGIHDIIAKKELDIFLVETIESFKNEVDREIIKMFLDEKTFDYIVKNTNCNYRHVLYIVDRFEKRMVTFIKNRNYK